MVSETKSAAFKNEISRKDDKVFILKMLVCRNDRDRGTSHQFWATGPKALHIHAGKDIAPTARGEWMELLAMSFETTGLCHGGHDTAFQARWRRKISRHAGKWRHNRLTVVDHSIERGIGEPLTLRVGALSG